MSKLQDLKNKQILTLTGDDVAYVLEVMGREDLADDLEEFEELMDYLYFKMEMPWAEYLQHNIENYIDNKED